ncbi:MAG: hypothetical protein QNJ48_08340 [Desulfobacterales bacterium]|nr:hypothetical protein [Desulfobacterales bacterium]MDJ0873941.1 hypothetical protein [Desulfobacterales bacterium]MDJ0884157.1 hypothetical protein [Desulfobacterales bacterium]
MKTGAKNIGRLGAVPSTTAAGTTVVTGLNIGGLLGMASFMTISGLSKGWWDAAAGLETQTAGATPSPEEEKGGDAR